MDVVFVEEGHKYYDGLGNEYPSVSWILEHFGISDMQRVAGIVGEKTMERSRIFGQVVHDTVMLDYQDKLESCDQEVEGVLIGWRQFVKDYKPKLIHWEVPIMSKEWGFAGRPDFIEDCGKWFNLPDLKTGVKTVAEEIQTALYQILVEEHYGKKVKDRYSVHLGECSYKIVKHSDKGDIQTAKCLLNILRYKKRKGLLWGNK